MAHGEPITTLSRDQLGRIIEKYDHAQRLLDETHAAALAACGNDTRGPVANALVVELDKFAEATLEHRAEVGRMLDALGEDS